MTRTPHIPRRRWLLSLGVGFLALALLPGAVPAQDFRGHAWATARTVEVRPIAQDTVARSQVTELPGGGLAYQGRPVTCRGDECTFYRSSPSEHALHTTQDLRFTAWGFGLEGLSATVHVRGRQDVGGDFTWPRSDDPFDAIVAYAQYNRPDLRVRLGRQRTRSGLGFASYDGASVLAEPLDGLSLEAYGGRSLARGLHDPRNEALEGVEDFLPDRDAWLLGAAATVEGGAGSSLTARYQREIFSNRAALLSERASVDGRTSVLAPVRLTGSMDYDFARGEIGKSHLSAELPVTDDLVLEARGRRYMPYFELWTIWGLFSPVAYHEGRLGASWSATSDLGLQVSGGARSYEDTHTDPILGPVEDDAWFASASGRWSPASDLRLHGRYRVERGAGAFLSSGELGGRWRASDLLALRLDLTASQQIEEFRIGEGMLAGGTASVELRPLDGVRLDTGVSVYRQYFDNRPSAVDWNQLRGWSTLRLDLGGDPALEGR
ncbi:MAG: hypothetical protein Q8W44_11650 [Candidatus Palauibacterales bacterium]|nr:hypothetical protein [Candidatus Palauibacterales bacterium]